MSLRTGCVDRAAVLRALSRRASYLTRGVGDSKTSSRSQSQTTPRAETAGSLPPPSLAALQGRLKDWHVFTTSSLRHHADHFSQKAISAFSSLGSHLNRVTGYDEIETLKRQVVAQEARIKSARRTAKEAKLAYDDAVLQRSVSQRRVNDLLQRKSSWTDNDVSDFTSLVRSDHSFEQEEARTKTHVAATEDAVERELSELMRVILARYHEEQVWSDKIRSASTYGSLAVLGVNVLVFIMAILIVEPWKRRRLAQTFERKVEEMGAETKALMDASATRLEGRLKGHETLMAELVTQVSAEAHRGPLVTATAPENASLDETPPPDPSWWSHVYFSYPYLGVVRGRELTLVVGSAAAGGLVTLITHSLFAR